MKAYITGIHNITHGYSREFYIVAHSYARLATCNSGSFPILVLNAKLYESYQYSCVPLRAGLIYPLKVSRSNVTAKICAIMS